MPAGRPTKLTPEKIEAVRRHLEYGNYLSVVLSVEKIPQTTHRRYMTLGEEFPEGIYAEYRSAVLTGRQKAETTLVKRIHESDDPRIAIEMLERMSPKRWGKRYRLIEADLRELIKRAEKLIGTPLDAPSLPAPEVAPESESSYYPS